MIEMTLYHCGIRGENISDPQLLKFNSREEAKRIVDESPHVKGVEYFYGLATHANKHEVFDPTGEHMRNLEERFIRAILG